MVLNRIFFPPSPSSTLYGALYLPLALLIFVGCHRLLVNDIYSFLLLVFLCFFAFLLTFFSLSQRRDLTVFTVFLFYDFFSVQHVVYIALVGFLQILVFIALSFLSHTNSKRPYVLQLHLIKRLLFLFCGLLNSLLF